MVKMEEATNGIEVAACNVNAQQQDFPLAAVGDSPPSGYQNSSDSKHDENLLLCCEEIKYPDDSEDEISPEDTLSGSMSGSSHVQYSNNNTMIVSNMNSSPAQFSIPSTPSNNSILFSPNPWLTSARPQIGNAFSNFSPPMQPLQAQDTPKLHHLSPPVPITGVYSPCISLPGSSLPGSPQFFPMFDAGQRDFHFLTGECACNVHQ